MKRPGTFLILLLALVALVSMTSCLHYYLPVGYKKGKPSTANNTILVGNNKIEIYLGERKIKDTMYLSVGLGLMDVPKERKLRISDLKITVKDPRLTKEDWQLKGIYMRRLDRHKTEFEIKDSITGQALNDAHRFDLSEGDLYTIFYSSYATPIKKRPSKLQVDVEGNLESVEGIIPFRKTILYTYRSGVEILH